MAIGARLPSGTALPVSWGALQLATPWRSFMRTAGGCVSMSTLPWRFTSERSPEGYPPPRPMFAGSKPVCVTPTPRRELFRVPDPLIPAVQHLGAYSREVTVQQQSLAAHLRIHTIVIHADECVGSDQRVGRHQLQGVMDRTRHGVLGVQVIGIQVQQIRRAPDQTAQVLEGGYRVPQ